MIRLLPPAILVVLVVQVFLLNETGSHVIKGNGTQGDKEQDLDTYSKVEEIRPEWKSVLKMGQMTFSHNVDADNPLKMEVSWENGDNGLLPIYSGLSYADRGMELSLLKKYEGKLLACDDRTGVLYDLQLNWNSTKKEVTPVPWVILADGSAKGVGPKGFKCEWATVKDGYLYVGGQGITIMKHGKANINSKYVKKISPKGQVIHINWQKNFERMAQALNIHLPGYVTHEAGAWSETLQKWVFLPRKISKRKFSHAHDSRSGSNVMLLSDENFKNISVVHVGPVLPRHGFSAFKFLPGSSDEVIVALKSLEDNSNNMQATYLMAFDIAGNVIEFETKIADGKYEGIEFI